ncbi:hypothetical protein NC651_035002 [Populus alba x Populus x berolinensis]|nr:hypothetical protein NC651_035002 [Populus alba x Populus x berolinensis]
MSDSTVNNDALSASSKHYEWQIEIMNADTRKRPLMMTTNGKSQISQRFVVFIELNLLHVHNKASST